MEITYIYMWSWFYCRGKKFIVHYILTGIWLFIAAFFYFYTVRSSKTWHLPGVNITDMFARYTHNLRIELAVKILKNIVDGSTKFLIVCACVLKSAPATALRRRLVSAAMSPSTDTLTDHASWPNPSSCISFHVSYFSFTILSIGAVVICWVFIIIIVFFINIPKWSSHYGGLVIFISPQLLCCSIGNTQVEIRNFFCVSEIYENKCN